MDAQANPNESVVPPTSLRIAHVEISRFRRLQAVRLDFERDTTILVGANNSGKTAALAALRLFLSDRKGFTPYDIGAENWQKIRAIGKSWAGLTQNPTDGDSKTSNVPWADQLRELNDAMPMLDFWFDVRAGSFHHVSHLIPTLDWSGGLLGVRFRLEPATDVKELQKLAWSYCQARLVAQSAATKAPNAKSRAWPVDLLDYWQRHPSLFSKVAAYKLDPAKLEDPGTTHCARPQSQIAGSTPLMDDPLANVVRIDSIPAQRGFGENEADKNGGRETSAPGMFSRQVVKLALRRFDRGPFEQEAQREMQAAIADAQAGLDAAMEHALKDVKEQVRLLGYPGPNDPKEIEFRSRVRTSDLLDHNTAVQYGIDNGQDLDIRLPEHAIGLGFQNLQSLAYSLCAFKEERLKPSNQTADSPPAPVHLVLVEEPEAHLHVQAQRLFVAQAYHIVKPPGRELTTQLVISTHSSHVAHAVSFAKLRYFRRTPTTASEPIPGSAIIGLQDVFGKKDDTAPGQINETIRFAERYLKIQHSDLLFADAAVFMEGTAERLLVPQFAEKQPIQLASCYVSYLEVGGSHAHRLRPLVERLGIPTLIITDLDPADKSTRKKTPVRIDAQMISTNPTIAQWVPGQEDIGNLLNLKAEGKELNFPSWPSVRVRVAYQVPGKDTLPCGSSFEDAFVLENLDFFKSKTLTDCTGPMEQMRHAVVEISDPAELAKKLHDILGNRFEKAQFALDLLLRIKNEAEIHCPRYIEEGLQWLSDQLSPPNPSSPAMETQEAA